MCAPSPPPPPDYVGAAKQQGEANLESTIAGGKINNPNVINPYGTQTVTWGGPIAHSRENFDPAAYIKQDPQVAAQGFDPWYHWLRYGQYDGRKFTARKDATGAIPTVTQTFSPEQKKLFDQSNALKEQLGLIGLQGTNSLKGLIGTGVNFDNAPHLSSTDFASGAPALYGTDFTSGAPAFRGSNFVQGAPDLPGNAESVRDQAISSMMGRVNEDTRNQRREANSELIASGIRPGTKAYDDRMNLINRQYNDARQQAILAGGQEAQRLYGMDMGRRQQYVGEREAMSREARTQRGQYTNENQDMFRASGLARELATKEAQQKFGATAEARRQYITELLSKRQIPLNEITALMSGSQVSNPFSMPGYLGTNAPQPTPIFAAQNALGGYNTDIFNQQAASAANQQAGLMGLGGAAIMGGMMLF